MKNRVIILLALFSTAFSEEVQSDLSSQPQRTREYRPLSTEPVAVVNRTGGAEQEVMLVGIEGNSLVFDTGSGEFLVPMNEVGLKIDFIRPKDYFKATKLVREGKFAEAIEPLEKIALPLVRYLKISQQEFNIHTVVRTYYRALVEADLLERAYRVAIRLPENAIKHRFLGPTRTLLSKLIASGRNDRALTLLSTLQKILNEEQFFPIAIDAANRFRAEEEYESAQVVYYTFHDSPDPEVRQASLLWSVYCEFRRDRPRFADILRQDVGQVSEDSDLFPLILLVDGIRAYQAGEIDDALKNFSRSNILLEVRNPMKPEFGYHVALSYLEIGENEAAGHILNEQMTFYPNSVWTSRLQETINPQTDLETEEDLENNEG